jgi:hypothetical protein
VLTAQLVTLSPSTRRSLRRVAILAAIVGLAIGIQAFVLHITTDPFADARLYYDAGTRLNNGQPLYVPSPDPAIGPYINPPLLAIAFRPLALLPFPAAAAIWEVVVVGSFVLTLRRIGLREPVLIALGCLALPILWALAIGQAELIITLLLAIGSPASVAVAGHVKLVPLLVAVYWIGRRDWRSLTHLAGWVVALGVVQLVLEPAATLAWLRLEWLRTAFGFRNISPFAIHPLLWVATVAVLLALALRFAPTRFGWPLAIMLAVFAYPRLLVYQLTTLLAAFGGPTHPVTDADRP